MIEVIDDVLENASQELNTLLDARFPVPIPKAFLYAEATDGSDTPQYDPIIIRTTKSSSSSSSTTSTTPIIIIFLRIHKVISTFRF